MTSTIELAAADGHRFGAYFAEPAAMPRGAIVVVQEIFGVNSHIRSVADGYAAEGYRVIAPALFDRVLRGVELGYGPDDVTRGRELRGKIDLAATLSDVAASIEAVATAGKVGIVGYCWGGSLVWHAAAELTGLACGVSYYGAAVPAHVALRPRCPVMFHFGVKDASIPLEGVERLRAAQPDQIVHVYDADHGFNCDQRGSYDAPSASLARDRSLAFFREYVG